MMFLLLHPCRVSQIQGGRVGSAAEDRLDPAVSCSWQEGPCQPWKAPARGCLRNDQPGGIWPLPGTVLRWAEHSLQLPKGSTLPRSLQLLVQGKEQLNRFGRSLCICFFLIPPGLKSLNTYSLMAGREQLKPCEKSLLKYSRLLILAYQLIETFGINSVAILPKDFSNSISFFFLKHCIL